MSSNSDLWQHLHRSDANRLLSCQSAMQHSSRKAHLSFLLNHDDMSNSDSDMDTTASRSVPSNRIKHEFSAETPNSIRNPYISKPHPPPTINQTLHSGVYLQTFLSPLLTPPSGRSLNSPAGVHEMPASLQESLLLYQHPPPSRESYDLKASKVTADTSNEQRGVRKKRQRKFMCPTCGFGFYTNSDMQKVCTHHPYGDIHLLAYNDRMYVSHNLHFCFTFCVRLWFPNPSTFSRR